MKKERSAPSNTMPTNDDFIEDGSETQALDVGEKRSTQQLHAVNDADAQSTTARPDSERPDGKIIDFTPPGTHDDKGKTRGTPVAGSGNVAPKLDEPETETHDRTPINRPPLPKGTFTASGESRANQPDTAILSSSNDRLRQKLAANSIQGTASLGDKREIIFVIRSMVERFVLSDADSIILGRNEPGSRPESDMIDLTPYGALDRGVSRQHVRLHLKDNHLYVTDLGSTNGTFLAGKRLRANEPSLLHKGDELLLGRLAVQVLFR